MPKVIEAPPKYAGQWIVWNHDHTEVIANAETLKEIKKLAQETGVEQYWLDLVPSDQEFFSGAATFQ